MRRVLSHELRAYLLLHYSEIRRAGERAEREGVNKYRVYDRYGKVLKSLVERREVFDCEMHDLAKKCLADILEI